MAFCCACSISVHTAFYSIGEQWWPLLDINCTSCTQCFYLMPMTGLIKRDAEFLWDATFKSYHHIQHWCHEDPWVSNANSYFEWQATASWIISHWTFHGWPFQSSAWAAVMWKADGRESDMGSGEGEQCPVAPAPARVLWISNGFLIYHKNVLNLIMITSICDSKSPSLKSSVPPNSEAEL